MPRLIDIREELDRLVALEGRTPDTPESEEEAVFAQLGVVDRGEVYVGSFSGTSPWERHPDGNELVHILEGHTTLTIMTGDGPESFEAGAGTFIVVPAGLWHRFDTPNGVTVMTVTPPPTEHSATADPSVADSFA
jgi:quercetin dioxygenase-like cupin family protein